jgi:AhpD family alkylhydroperoxidase
MITETVNERISSRIRYVKLVPQSAVTGATAELYQQIKADFMPAPLLMLHSASPQIMSGVWSILRETLLAGDVDRAVKEIVAAAVSKNNECNYCLEAHTLLLRSTSGHAVADAILRERYDDIEDSQLRSMFEWALTTKTASTIREQPFASIDAPQIIGTMVTFQYINRMVKLFLGDTLLPVPSVLKGMTRRVYTATEGKNAIRQLQSGQSLKFVPQAPLPHDLEWARTSVEVQKAFAGMADIVRHAGPEVLSDHVRAIVSDYVLAWNGESMGHDYRWVEDAVRTLDAESRVTARLALETALAGEVRPETVDNFRLHNATEAQLIDTTAWASFTAATRVGVWLTDGFTNDRRKQ